MADELHLRCCAPSGTSHHIVTHAGVEPMYVRTELLMEYHNSRGHPGRDATFEAIARDWWWPRMYSDIKDALTGCTVCACQHAVTRVSVWTRTTLYMHPLLWLCKVFWPWNVWPGVLRSDNAYEFIGEVIRCVNAKLEIRHITGAAYRPQNQGLAETRVKLVTTVLRGFVNNHPHTWLY